MLAVRLRISGPDNAVLIIPCTVGGVALEKFMFALLLVV
jgi:hypothetical protein